jgi:hypothetical protein
VGICRLQRSSRTECCYKRHLKALESRSIVKPTTAYLTNSLGLPLFRRRGRPKRMSGITSRRVWEISPLPDASIRQVGARKRVY